MVKHLILTFSPTILVDMVPDWWTFGVEMSAAVMGVIMFRIFFRNTERLIKKDAPQ